MMDLLQFMFTDPAHFVGVILLAFVILIPTGAFLVDAVEKLSRFRLFEINFEKKDSEEK